MRLYSLNAIHESELAWNAVPLLGCALQDEHKKVRERAAFVLSHLGEHAAPAIPDLIEALKESSGIAADAANALAQIGLEAITPLVDTLKGGDKSAC